MPQLPTDSAGRRALLLSLLAERAYRRGQFTLASGRSSEHYVNCKPVSLSGVGLALLGAQLLAEVEEGAAAVAGLTLGADPLVSAVAMAAALNPSIALSSVRSAGCATALPGGSALVSAASAVAS